MRKIEESKLMNTYSSARVSDDTVKCRISQLFERKRIWICIDLDNSINFCVDTYLMFQNIIGIVAWSAHGWIWVMSQVTFCWLDFLLHLGARQNQWSGTIRLKIFQEQIIRMFRLEFCCCWMNECHVIGSRSSPSVANSNKTTRILVTLIFAEVVRLLMEFSSH